MLSAIFNIIMYEECKNLWSMSRPLLGLILVCEDVRVMYNTVYVVYLANHVNIAKLNVHH